MIDENKVVNAIQKFSQKPAWKKLFEEAPGGAMERLAISFYYSVYKDQLTGEEFDDYRKTREEIEKTLDEEDLNYLIQNINKQKTKQHYEELLNNLKQNPEIGKEQKEAGLGGGLDATKDGEQQEQSAQPTQSASQPEQNAQPNGEPASESSQTNAEAPTDAPQGVNEQTGNPNDDTQKKPLNA